MKPINFPQANVVFAKDQPQYQPLSAHRSSDGIVTSCWSFNLWERLTILFTGKLYLQIHTYNTPLQPIRLQVGNPFLKDEAEQLPSESTI